MRRRWAPRSRRDTLVDFVSAPAAPIKGWRDHKRFDCPRQPGESDEDLAEGVQAKASATPGECRAVVLCSYDDVTE